MGCFDGRCALTQTAIGWGDPVLAFEVPEDKRRDGLYSFSGYLGQHVRDVDQEYNNHHSQLSTLTRQAYDRDSENNLQLIPALTQPEAIEVINRVLLGEVSEKVYREVTGRKLLEGHFMALHLMDGSPLLNYVGVGTYNDYGWIDEDAHRSDREMAGRVMIHLSAARKVYGKKITFQTPKTELLYVVRELVYFARRTRVQLFDPWGLLGQQHHDLDEIERQELRVKMTQAILKKQKKQIKKYREENGF